MSSAASHSLTPDPLTGTVFADRYLVRSLIARGSTGRVYLAEQLPLMRPVALKVLDVGDLSGPAGDRHRERFLREASILAQLSHANTVRLYDYGTHGPHPYVAMEYVGGRTLRTLLGSSALDPVRTVRIVRQICASLQEAHALGLVHRDLKPANVLVVDGMDGADLVKVVDFGLVKEVDDALHMTGEGVMVGTPMFMAPEQIRGLPLDQRCDVYAVGIMLYRMLSGQYPYAMGQQAAVLMAHLTETARPLSQVAPGLPAVDRFDEILASCLAKDPRDRMANVAELLRALKLVEASLLDAAGSPPDWSIREGRVVVGPRVRPARPGREAGRAVAVVAGVGAVLVFSLLFGFVFVRGWAAATRAPVDPGVPAPIAVNVASPLPEPEVTSAPPPAPAPPAQPVSPRAAPGPAAALPAVPPAAVTAPKPVVGTSDLRDPWVH